MSQYNFANWKTVEEPEVETMTKVTRGKQVDNLLYDLLTTVSPHGRENLISDIIIQALTSGTDKRKRNFTTHLDVKGNLIVKVGDYKKSKVMFSSHMDTVQSKALVKTDLRLTDEGHIYASYDKEVSEYIDNNGKVITKDEIGDFAEESGFKYPNYILMGKGKNKRVYGSDNEFDDWKATDIVVGTQTSIKPVSSVLGADDKLGCYIMCKLILNNTEGLYVFHIGEECGGIGSSYIATSTPEVVEGMNYCIAFDRYEYGHIITHQSGGRCCSDDFVDGLAAKLNPLLPPKQQMSGNSGGSFTDSANYTKLIPECTNVSVSYKSQHTSREHFDLVWFNDILIPALMKITWHDLPVVRDPNEVSTPYGSRYSSGYTSSLYNRTYASYKSERSVVSTRSSLTNSERMNQSTIDKCNHLLSEKFDGYDPEEGLPQNMSAKQKVDFVRYTFVKNNLSIEEMAEMVVDAEEEADKRLFEDERLDTLGFNSSFDSRRYDY